MVKVLDNDLNAGQIAIELDPIAENPKATPKKGKRGANSKPRTESADTAAQEKDKGTRRKALLSTYEPDKRLESWLKVKKDYNTSADTLDLIPIAGWHGQGRKAKWWSPILLAVRNPESGTLVAVTKCISGFTDDFYKANRTKYDPDTNTNVINKPSYIEYSAGNPDVWFEPQEVWEMVFADVTLSPTYTAAIGLVSEERGLSLRFPRFLKVREDKSIEEASTDEFLADLYRTQEARAPGAGQGQVQGVEDED
jgi:DNA ligase-1